MIKKFLTLISLILLLTGCKIDFTGDLYTSDLIDLANTTENKQFNLPMEVASSIMHIVRLAVEGRQWQSWPFLDVSRQPFFIN